MSNKKNSKRRGQVWIESVTYTLVAFVLIGLVLSFAKPKIEEIQDASTIQKTQNMIKDISSIVDDVIQSSPGNKRMMEISLRKGDFIIDGTDEEIKFEITTNHKYSEENQEIKEAGLLIKTEPVNDEFKVTMKKSYLLNYNITFEGKDELKTLTQSPTPYKIFVTNRGGSPSNIDFELA